MQVMSNSPLFGKKDDKKGPHKTGAEHMKAHKKPEELKPADSFSRKKHH